MEGPAEEHKEVENHIDAPEPDGAPSPSGDE